MQKFIKYSITTLLLVLFSRELNAQTYNFTNYNVSEGLEQSDIITINQAANGSLVYGTYGGGVGVYDGYGFSAIKEKHGLANNTVLSIDVDKNGSIWVATRNGISVINKEVNKVKKNYFEGTSFYWVHVQETTSDIWFGSALGLYKYNTKLDSVKFYKTSNEVLNTSFINCIYSDVGNNLWIGTKNAGVFSIDAISGKVSNYLEKDGLSSNYVKTIIEGKKGEIFIGTVQGLNLITKNVVSLIDLPKIEGSSLTFTSSSNYKNQLVFGALNNQLYFVDKSSYQTKFIAANNGFVYQKIWSVFTDKEDNLWLGSIGAGLVKFNPVFTFFNAKNEILSDDIRSVFESSEGKIYVGTNVGFNVINESGAISTYKPLKELSFSNVFHFNEYKGTMLLGTNIGLFKFINEKAIPIPFSEKGYEDNIYFSYKSKDKFYVGGKMGLYYLENDTLFTVKKSPKESIYDIITYKGSLFLAADNGVYKYARNTFQFLSKKEGLECDRARSFKIDSKNNLWIGTSNSAYLYNGKNFKKITEEDGLTSENIYLMELDGKGNIWLGTNKGIDRINIESVYQYWNNPENKIEIRNYGKNEGFNGVECNLNAVYRNKKKQLYFGTINGVYKYHSENDAINKQPPVLAFKNIKLNFQDVDWSKYSKNINSENGLPNNLELRYNNNNLIFEFVGVSLTNPKEVHYQYKLEGLDEDWLPLTKDRKAVYTAIPHGNYTFRLKAKNSDGVWTESDLAFKFSISPPWYKTTWFYMSATLIVLLIGYTVLVLRTRNLRKTQIILTTKVEERTHELREEKEKVESINVTLAEQKKVIEVANKNITDSINYAKKIQEAILPKPVKLEELKDSVSILYLPKDVVSGDFYWFEKMGNKYIFATADCTGHGVPGAFMSMIGVNNLNQIIIENKVTSPDKILRDLNIAIKKVLKQDDVDSESRDGMDISISCFDLDKKVISYAGAFRPLIYIRNNELFELKGSRQPIGGSAPIDFEYELNEFEYQEGDVFYMFSDGFPDQFGGLKGKKFMNRQLKEIFIKIYKESPLVQREILKNELEHWRGNNEQIDDVLVMCIKI